MRNAILGAALAAAACGGEMLDPRGSDGGTIDLVPDAEGGGVRPDASGGGSPDASPGPRPGDGVAWVDYPEQNGETDATWCADLTDVAQHIPIDWLGEYWDSDRVTAAHETTHGIHAYLRNNLAPTGARTNAFYVLGDRAAFVEEPAIRKSDVAPYIPQSLRGYRYETYISGQVEWDDTPLYVWDEWIAYVNGGAVGVDQVQCGQWNQGWRDAVSGPLEFTIYGLAVGRAVAAGDPAYFATNTQFREFLAWAARRAMEIYREGSVLPDFAWDEQEAMAEALRTAPDAQDLRDWVVQTYGPEWANEVLGI